MKLFSASGVGEMMDGCGGFARASVRENLTQTMKSEMNIFVLHELMLSSGTRSQQYVSLEFNQKLSSTLHYFA
jgi:hypothetical protein